MERFFETYIPLIKKFIGRQLESLGGIWLICEIVLCFYEDNSQNIENMFCVAIYSSIIMNLIMSFPKKSFSYLIKDKDIRVKLVIGDILKQKSSIVIPTNTTFDTTMENDFISLKSVQGQMQSEFFKNNINTLDKLIEQELKNNLEYEELTDNRNTKSKKYSIGTTIEINQNCNRWYLVADSNVNPSGQTISPSMTNITDALIGLWQYISEKGHVETISIPIIGTGRMGLNVSREKIIKQIIFSFVANNNVKKIATELIICIRKEDIKKYNISINRLNDYLKYICEYYYENIGIEEKRKIGVEI